MIGGSRLSRASTGGGTERSGSWACGRSQGPVRLPSLRISLLARFALLSLVPTLLLGLVLARDLRQTIRDEAITDARTVAKLTARLRVQPLLELGDLRGPLSREIGRASCRERVL